jgi:hypothetical protein
MKFTEKLFFAACIAICLIVVVGQIHDSEACKSRGGQWLRGQLSGYECYKAELVK